jgi:hypothetical protein
MSIVQISRITVRKGLQQNLPQLAGAEFGWAIDEQRLFIGNGLVSDGAPFPGNTEILTSQSVTNLLSITGLYTYKGERAGYAVQTGPTVTPLTRSLQEKLDEYVSVLDFGAMGDGSANDTAAVNRAAEQLFCIQTNIKIRRALYFPAGTYLLDGDSLKIPPYAIIYGDGPDSTIIKRMDAAASNAQVIEFVDSKFQSQANIGSNSATPPTQIVIRDLTFEHAEAKNIAYINQVTDVSFTRVHFKGKFTQPSPADEAAAPTQTAVSLISSVGITTSNVKFDQCEISGCIRGFALDDDVEGINITGSYLHDLYQGIRVGQTTLPGAFGGTNLRVSNSLFKTIYDRGILVETVPSVVSSFNQFINVGEHYLGSLATSIIDFGNDNCASVFDYFSNPDTTSIKNVTFEVGTRGCSVVSLTDGVRLGWLNIKSGETYALPNNAAGFVSGAAIADSTNVKGGKISYVIDRSTAHRSGEMKFVVTDAGALAWDDEYQENTTVDVTLTMALTGTDIEFSYVTANTGIAADIRYSLQTFE